MTRVVSGAVLIAIAVAVVWFAPPVIFGAGWLSYRLVMRPVVHASHNVQVFTTVGLSIALQNLALVLWTADAHFIRTPYYSVVVRLGGAAFNLAQLVAFVIAVLATAGQRWIDLAMEIVRAQTFVKTPAPAACVYCPFSPVCGDHHAHSAALCDGGHLAAFRDLER